MRKILFTCLGLAVVAILACSFVQYAMPSKLPHKWWDNNLYGLVADNYRNNTRKSDLDLLNDPPIAVERALTASNSRDLDGAVPDRLLDHWLVFRCNAKNEFVAQFSPSINFEEELTVSIRLDKNPRYPRIRNRGIGDFAVCKRGVRHLSVNSR